MLRDIEENSLGEQSGCPARQPAQHRPHVSKRLATCQRHASSSEINRRSREVVFSESSSLDLTLAVSTKPREPGRRRRSWCDRSRSETSLPCQFSHGQSVTNPSTNCPRHGFIVLDAAAIRPDSKRTSAPGSGQVLTGASRFPIWGFRQMTVDEVYCNKATRSGGDPLIAWHKRGLLRFSTSPAIQWQPPP